MGLTEFWLFCLSVKTDYKLLKVRVEGSPSASPIATQLCAPDTKEIKKGPLVNLRGKARSPGHSVHLTGCPCVLPRCTH